MSNRPEAGRGPASDRPVALRLFLTCWAVFALHFATNTVREIYPALSLGDHLSFDVSEYEGLHPDIFVHGDRAFINNNPGASILGALPYALARPAIDAVVARVQRAREAAGSGPREYDTIYPLSREFARKAQERGYDVKFGLAAGVVQVLLMAPLSALAAVVMFRLLAELGVGRRPSLALALLYAFATPVFYRTAQLNHNLLLCHAGFFAFVLLFRATPAPSGARTARFLGAGLLAGFSVVLDYTGVVTAIAIAAYAAVVWRQDPGRRPVDLAAFAGAMAASAAVLPLYQWASFGHPLWPAQHYMPDTEHSGTGYRGMGPPDLELLWLISFGLHYGLFTSAPLLVLALWPPSWRPGQGGLLPRRELAFALLFCAGTFLFTSANQFARMQFNSGVRHLVPAVPFLFLLAAGALLRLPRRAAVAVAASGTAVSWCLAMSRDVEQARGVVGPVVDVLTNGPRLPWLTTLQRMGYLPDGPWALAPMALVAAGLAALWWTLPRGALADQGSGTQR